MDEFNCSRIVATLGLSFFILGLGELRAVSPGQSGVFLLI